MSPRSTTLASMLLSICNLLAGIVVPLLVDQWLDNVWGIVDHSSIAHPRLQCKIEASSLSCQ